jgi:sulfide:quinone oxidoreductase
MSGHVVIAGGGVGALEGLLALQSLAPGPPHISVLTAGRHLTYRALSVAEPFGADPSPRYEWPEIARDRGVRWIPDVVVGVRPDARQIDTRDGPPVHYDALLLALGAQPKPALPGALTFAGPRDVVALRDAIEDLGRDRRHRVAFVAVSGTAWTLPLYELALLTAERAVRDRLNLAVELVTSESAPLGVFGTEASAAVARRLAFAGIHVRTGTVAEEFEDGKLWLELEGPLDVDLAVALPRLHGPALPGLPHGDDGFIPIDRFGRVRGTDGVWAVGDMTTRPLKQGGLAAQQADVAAADIAAHVLGARIDVQPYRPVLQGVLLTGEEPEFLQRRRHTAPASQAAREPLWSPAQKVVGRHLGPYLETLGVRPLPGRSSS